MFYQLLNKKFFNHIPLSPRPRVLKLARLEGWCAYGPLDYHLSESSGEQSFNYF